MFDNLSGVEKGSDCEKVTLSLPQDEANGILEKTKRI